MHSSPNGEVTRKLVASRKNGALWVSCDGFRSAIALERYEKKQEPTPYNSRAPPRARPTTVASFLFHHLLLVLHSSSMMIENACDSICWLSLTWGHLDILCSYQNGESFNPRTAWSTSTIRVEDSQGSN